MKRTRKKAQEEMVGFVLIVVLVAVIGVVILGISLRKQDTTAVQESEELNSFLSSISHFTTDCQTSELKYRTVGNLIVDCYEAEQCLDGKLTCKVLEDTLKNLLDHSTYVVSKQSDIVYYELKIYSGDDELTGELMKISEVVEGGVIGECKAVKIYNERDFSTQSQDMLHLRFEVCYRLE